MLYLVKYEKGKEMLELPKILHLLSQKAYPDITDLGYFLSPDIVTYQDRYNFQIQVTSDG
jgi:hypothetical protein